MKKLVLLLGLILPTLCIAQEKQPYSRKGQGFVYWGYNRSTYTKSDITFIGQGYNFTLHDVVAKDAPSPLGREYYDPALFSIPQFNIRGGYFFSDHWAVSIGWDHMKYVMVNDQQSTISGTISAQVSNPAITVNPAYVGTFDHKPITVNSKDFLTFEHTDGFNFASVDLDRYDRLWKAKNGIQGLDWIVGGSVGAFVPRSDVRLFTVGKNNYWNVAGYGFALKAGLQFDITKHVFLRNDIKGGFSRLNDIRTTGRDGDYAKQSIWYLEDYFVLGFTIGKMKK
ncbi:hypothetical protein GOQ04_08895 [Emticicia sp. ODNR4P]|nr:hypothetical protein [Emticicia sp. ODNR4P]